MKSNAIPKVSIILPVFNGSKYLASAIESALNQTYQSTEIIVVNDGSSDEGRTASIAESYVPRIRYLEKDNGGVASALNAGIRAMTGEYFSWLSHDDLYYPRKVERQVEDILRLGAETILFSDYDVIDENSRFLYRHEIRILSPDSMFFELLRSYPVNGCTVLIHRDWFSKIGLFEEELRTTQDYDYWFRLATLAKFHHVPEALIASRQHSEQGSVANRWAHLRESSALGSLYLSRVPDLFREVEPSALLAHLYPAIQGLADKHLLMATIDGLSLFRSFQHAAYGKVRGEYSTVFFSVRIAIRFLLLGIKALAFDGARKILPPFLRRLRSLHL